MPQQGKFTAADVDQPSSPPQSGQQGQFSAADVDGGSQPSALDSFAAKLPGSADTGLQGAVHHLGDTWNAVKSMAKPLWDVSAPAIGNQIYKRLSGQPNELNELPKKMVTQFALMGAEAPEAEELTAARQGAQAVTESEGGESAPGMLSRAWEKAKDRIPGVKAYRDLDYVVNGPKEAPKPAPTPTPIVPDYWGKGGYGTPVDQWGQRIPQPGQAGSIAKSMEQAQSPAPIQRGSLRQMMNDLQDQVGEGLGASPAPNPKAPIYQRGSLSEAMKPSDIAQGHTPVQSSALKSFKYDPESREFEVITPSGSGYAYGDVSPEEAEAFGKAESKGKAWQAIRSNPLVRKTVNGKWQSVKPATPAQ